MKKRYTGGWELIYNGDANGAYNIARKGVLIIKKIVAGEKSTIVKQVECDDAWQNAQK